jgi:hypothetical protein
MDAETCTYAIDADDRICFLSPEWVVFAFHNGGSELTPDVVLGRSLWDFVAGAKTRHLYQILLERVRTSKKSVTVPFRCDSPSLRRSMELMLTPTSSGGIEFRSQLVHQEPRTPVVLRAASKYDAADFLRICSWCKRVAQDHDTWVEIEEALARAQLFIRDDLPELTHTICSQCDEMMHSLIEKDP